MNQDQRIFQISLHSILVVDEVGREITAVKLHALNHFQLVVKALAFFHCDDAFFADLFHRFSNNAADRFVRISRNRAYLGDFLVTGARLGNLDQLRHRGDYCLVDAALEIHRVHAGGYRLQTLTQHGLGQYGCGRGAITSHVRSLGSHFLEHLRTHILELIFQFNFLGNRNTIFGHGRCTKRFIEHHVAALGAQRHFYSIRQNVYAAHLGGSGGFTEFHFFS